MKISAAATLATVLISANIPVMFHGAPGLGKSDLTRQLAGSPALVAALTAGDTALQARLGGRLPVVDIRAANFDRVDLSGIPSVVAGRTVWNPPALLPDPAIHGPVGILFLDELTNAPLSVQGSLLQLLLDRKLGEYVLPPGWRIVAAGNRQADRASANRLSTAASNRLAHIEIEADSADWTAWAGDNGLHAAVVAFIQFRPNLLHVMPTDNAPAFPSPRAWASVARALDAAGPGWAGLAYDVARALVGEAAALELSGFVACWTELPRLPEIESNPAGAPVPRDMTAKYAVAALLGRTADPARMGAFVTYADRLGVEFSTLTVQQATRRAPALKETAAYVGWAIAHADVTL